VLVDAVLTIKAMGV